LPAGFDELLHHVGVLENKDHTQVLGAQAHTASQRAHRHEGFLAGLVHHHAVAVTGAQEEQVHVLVVERAVTGRFLDFLLRFRVLVVELGQNLVTLLADGGAFFFLVVTLGPEQSSGGWKRRNCQCHGRNNQGDGPMFVGW
jgi:hypothetical protein